MQEVTLKGEYSFASAQQLIKWLVEQGFSVDASQEGKVWTIEATKFDESIMRSGYWHVLDPDEETGLPDDFTTDAPVVDPGDPRHEPFNGRFA